MTNLEPISALLKADAILFRVTMAEKQFKKAGL